ncbi:Methylesterase 17 [Bienertia sinuspersici]
MASESEMSKVPIPAHFVLVHGASHGGWCWYKIRCLLEIIGHKVSCPDLTGSGIDPSDADTIFTFQECNKPLHDILASLPVGEKGKRHSSTYEEICDYGYGEGRDNPPTSVIVKKEFQREILYQMSPLKDCTLASLLLRPCPIRALGEAMFTNDKDSDTVPRVYIKTLHDNIASLENQDSVIKNWPPSDVYTIDSDHCPMFSNPSQLFGLHPRLKIINFNFVLRHLALCISLILERILNY